MRIGLLTVKTGPLAQGGIQMEQGLTAFLKDKNYTLAGRKVELVVADTGGNPAGAKTKAQELVERDKVDFIVGPLAAFELLAITDYVAAGQGADAEPRRRRRHDPAQAQPLFRSARRPPPPSAATRLATTPPRSMKLKRVATISEDFAFGYEQMGGFQRVFEDDGGKVVQKLWPPLVTADYTPYLAQIEDVDGVCHGFAGSNPVKFTAAIRRRRPQGEIPRARRLDRA